MVEGFTNLIKNKSIARGVNVFRQEYKINYNCMNSPLRSKVASGTTVLTATTTTAAVAIIIVRTVSLGSRNWPRLRGL